MHKRTCHDGEIELEYHNREFNTLRYKKQGDVLASWEYKGLNLEYGAYEVILTRNNIDNENNKAIRVKLIPRIETTLHPSDLDKAILLATKAHLGQSDKAGLPYILHPLYLMNQCDTLHDKICAVLHDVVEDTDVTMTEILKEFGWNVWKTVDMLTHRPYMSYESYIGNLYHPNGSVRIKLLDIEHNMDLTRLNKITEKDIERACKYMRAKGALLQAHYN